MNTLGNLVIGAALAAACLAPVAASDADRLLNGGPVAMASLGGATSNIACDVEHVLGAARMIFPRLLVDAMVRSPGPQTVTR
jgi:hypothetical protein